MQYVKGLFETSVPRVIVGCMRIHQKREEEVRAWIESALSVGANFFDHADIYGSGECERLFGRALPASLRDKVILQSKCGICGGKKYDFSYEHIVESVEGSLSRLGTDYLDVLLLHRPDALCEPEEVARAFDRLYRDGKVRAFGVSNHSENQIRLLQKALDLPLVANQLQLSLMHTPLISAGFHVNRENEFSASRDGYLLDFCREREITVQAWSPVQVAHKRVTFLDNPDYPEINACLDKMAEKYGVSKTTVAIAWILRHPARMQVVTGTTNPERLRACIEACDVCLSRDDWYELIRAAGVVLP